MPASKLNIAIFGSGLSAGFVRQACIDFGASVTIFTNKPLETPVNLGHVLLRWVPEKFRKQVPVTKVSFFSIGSKDTYLARMKRFEDRSVSKSAFPESGAEHLTAYDPHAALKVLLPPSIWGTEKIVDCTDEFIAKTSEGFDHSFITFPLKSANAFQSTVGYWAHTAQIPFTNMPNHAIYNGTNSQPWLRFTCYWGVARWEYSHLEFPENEEAPPAPIDGIFTDAIQLRDIAPNTPEFTSPIPTTTAVGRFAQRSKGILAHDAYGRAESVLRLL